jgi:hypothetical protein
MILQTVSEESLRRLLCGKMTHFGTILSAGAILGHITPRERGAAAEEN